MKLDTTNKDESRRKLFKRFDPLSTQIILGNDKQSKKWKTRMKEDSNEKDTDMNQSCSHPAAVAYEGSIDRGTNIVQRVRESPSNCA
ncbi:hypothetical protein COLO4_19517 [Corchorus olitorius]|uniref:Uncharacterized protein n=1 Tax=Corchorus olitorius TaxID=93759 RepID=A0A1R3J538_9ROSI|nr:hypothetical protein COLO4_19517 [Corchorus olitorius]